MAWSDEMVLKLRAYINDLDPTTPTYTDEKLQQWILLSLSLLQLEFSLSQYYSTDIVNVTITPDPTLAPRDEACIGLTILKAGYIIMATEARIYGGQSIAIKDDDSSIDLKRDIKSIIAIADEFKTNYTNSKNSFLMGFGVGATASGFGMRVVGKECFYSDYWCGWEWRWRY